MLSAVNENKQFVLATESEKTDGNFFCKGCGSPVLLKKGDIKMHHFSHTKDRDCDWGLGGEGEEHYKLKLYLYNFLLQCKENKQIADVELEKNIDGLRADVWFKNNQNQEIAIEVQLSSRTEKYVSAKIKRYMDNNVASMYITDLWKRMVDAGGKRIRLTAWQKYLAFITNCQVLTYTELNDSFVIKNFKLSEDTSKETIYYVRDEKEVDILKDMIVVKESESLLYKVNSSKYFKQVYYNKKGREFTNLLLGGDFNFFDFSLGDKFNYFEKNYTGKQDLSFLPDDKCSYVYTFDESGYLIKEEFAEGSQPKPFYFKYKYCNNFKYLVICDDVIDCLRYIKTIEVKHLSSIKFCICLDENSAKQIDFSKKAVKVGFKLSRLVIEDFNIPTDIERKIIE